VNINLEKVGIGIFFQLLTLGAIKIIEIYSQVDLI